ncbi:two-component sensor histidine kinase [Clostridium gelidum]|uniref:histidine kinase n=1 Tax=Clostridium gelidum TaxID=704125 RepID=A0ABM7SZF2_9CLOT|nr:HAMP domain-containing sensor histidine kinase [Clostridium gelidum]BCZ45016.1 two-component sensor histidine kinase [Clostridium gelidum]
MRIFDIKDLRKLFISIIIILFSYILLGQVIITLITNDYKKELIKHDYEVAGYLYENKVNMAQLPAAFTHNKSIEDYRSGEILLRNAGYDESINNSLIPSVKAFHNKYAVIVFVLSLGIGIIFFTVLLTFAVKYNKTLEKANSDILNFMNGNYKIRLDDNKEGSLSKLFSAINMMGTSLITHITKEKQNKEFLKDTISDISHQLKTPLAALEMYNEIILDEIVDNDVVNSFNLKIKNELERMESLIQNLLKLAKLDAGAIELNKENCNLKGFLENIIMRFQTRAKFESKKVVLNCDNNISLIWDKEWMLESISNIIKNALEHTKSGNEISISCHNTSVAIIIMIKDNGLGIHSEDFHYIFKRFYRSKFSKNTQGVGIGLTLSKSIVEKHGGTIMVESELGKGTTFNLIFSKLTTL